MSKRSINRVTGGSSVNLSERNSSFFRKNKWYDEDTQSKKVKIIWK